MILLNFKNWLEKYDFESCFINSCLWSIIRSIRSVKIYIFCNNGVIGWSLVSKHKHVPQSGYWCNGIVFSCISSYKCSHLLDEGKIYNHLQDNLYVQKFHIHLLSKTLVSKIDKKKLSLIHGPRVEGHCSTISMYWIQRSWWFIDLSNGHQSMERWIPPATGF